MGWLGAVAERFLYFLAATTLLATTLPAQTLTAYDLDAHLAPATSSLAMHARVTLRNDTTAPLTHLTLQLSSTLHWDSITLDRQELPFTPSLLDTDADHTGRAAVADITLPTPLAPAASLHLDTFYSGTLAADSTRLTRIGASPAQAADSDWDAIAPGSVALRGFGNVLWYPVSSPPLFLGDGARLFQAIDAARARDQLLPIHLHLALDYTGEPPVAAYFCGRRQPLTALPDDPNAPTASGSGIATADFATEPLGFRLPSLFVLNQPEQILTPLLAVSTTDDKSLPALTASANAIAPLLQLWFGPHPVSALTLLDHPGQPFQDGPLLVAPIATLAASTSAEALAHSLAHAFVQTGQPWLDEGLPQFLALLYTEQQKGHPTALDEYHELLRPLILAEPAPNPAKGTASAVPQDAPYKDGATAAAASGYPEASASGLIEPIKKSGAGSPGLQPGVSTEAKELGQPLISATSELYFRRKSAAIFWMLRTLVGEGPLAQALTAWCSQPVLQTSPDAQAVAFEHLLETTSGKDLTWFFRDWVLHDRGLPDLSITAVEPRQLPAGQGHDIGWLVAVTVHNDGAATADVPLILRSGTLETLKRLRIPAFATVTERYVLPAPPTQVQLNDGTTPEQQTSLHTRDVALKTE
jgi:hypothetical protein